MSKHVHQHAGAKARCLINPKYWAEFSARTFFAMSRDEMDLLVGTAATSLVTVTPNVDHPSFGMAIILVGLLESPGLSCGDHQSSRDWQSKVMPYAAGRSRNLFFVWPPANMDSMINRYYGDRKIRSDDAYTPRRAKRVAGRNSRQLASTASAAVKLSGGRGGGGGGGRPVVPRRYRSLRCAYCPT